MAVMSAEYMREYRQRTSHVKRQRALDFMGGKCQECGSVEHLNFHHIDPLTKLFDISTGVVHRSWQAVLEELCKCVLICEDCHHKEHASQAPCGTAQRYWRGCRCRSCTAANTAHSRAYKARRCSSVG